MDYRAAYEALSSALWQYDKAHHEAYVRLMLAVRDIDRGLEEPGREVVMWPVEGEEK